MDHKKICLMDMLTTKTRIRQSERSPPSCYWTCMNKQRRLELFVHIAKMRRLIFFFTFPFFFFFSLAYAEKFLFPWNGKNERKRDKKAHRKMETPLYSKLLLMPMYVRSANTTPKIWVRTEACFLKTCNWISIPTLLKSLGSIIG